MADLEGLMKSGKELGLTGEQLLKFVKDERERSERLEKEKFAREERSKEREKEKFDREERAQEREMRKLEIEREIEIARARAGTVSSDRSDTRAKIPKLPNFNEKQDNLDTYLRRFERFAESAKWKRESWATNLSALLTGTALDVYSRMPVSEAIDYEKLKANLLKRFNLTEEGFREKFRKSKIEGGETAGQFVIRLGDYLDNWMAQARVSASFDGLKDLMLREQFMQSSGKGLQLFLKERKFESVTEMAASADRYIEAHVPDQNNKGNQGARQQNQNGKSCFHCSGPHLIRDCPEKTKKAAAMSGDKGRSYSYSSENLRGNHQNSGGRYERGNKDLHVSACCLLVDEMNPDSVAYQQKDIGMYHGYVGRDKVTVLRDTGSSTIIVKKALVNGFQFTGSSQRCVLLDGTVCEFPTAIIQVSSPFYTGTVKAMCVEDPVCDLIIGNVEGAKDVPMVYAKPELKEDSKGGAYTDSEDHGGIENIMVTQSEEAAVVTRLQAKKEISKPKPMRGQHEVDIGDVSKECLVKLQTEDTTLQGVRELADSGDVKSCGKFGTYRYLRENGIIFREYSSPKVLNGQGVKQLVVPKNYRSKILHLAHERTQGGHLGVKKTADMILAQYHWPGIVAVVKRYCTSCDICKRTISQGHPNKVQWNSKPDSAFESLKSSLVRAPILRTPDLEKQFILRTDASNFGIGAVLLQETEEGKFPVAYASRKLLVRERNYSVVEKKCLGVIWGIQKFHTFLYGKHFILETDRMPLVYLNKSKESNGRLMRWAMKLQAYRFTVVAIKGSDNVGADYLSRSSIE